jgi:pimeloyl-ACP methyl ester carboxylesterase
MISILDQAQLAEIARDSGVRKVLRTGDVQTVFWHYPAKSSKKTRSSLILIHGYRGNHHGLEAIAGAIQNFDVYIPDLPGFGQSTQFSHEHNIDQYASWLNEFIIALSLKKKPHLLGHSFGSIVVAAYAAKYKGIATLILENPVASPALKGPKAFMTNLTKGFFWLAGSLSEKSGLAILKSWPMVRGMSIVMTKSRRAKLRKWIHQQHDANFNDFANRRVALEGYSASISNCVGDYAAKVSVPVLMMIGDRDDITSVSQQQTLYQALSHTERELKSFIGVGHLTHYEIPREVAMVVEDWVDRHD